MGEDFLRRKNDRFRRQRDEHFAEQNRPDLFSASDPELHISVCGTSLIPLEEGRLLWAADLGVAGQPLDLLSEMGVAAARISPADADRLRQDPGESGAAAALVVTVDADYEIVELRIRRSGDTP
jgi:hypothetical protein